MTGSEVAGYFLWALIFTPWFIAKFKNRRKSVSRNNNSKAWEQDYPWPECFEEDDI